MALIRIPRIAHAAVRRAQKHPRRQTSKPAAHGHNPANKRRGIARAQTGAPAAFGSILASGPHVWLGDCSRRRVGCRRMWEHEARKALPNKGTIEPHAPIKYIQRKRATKGTPASPISRAAVPHSGAGDADGMATCRDRPSARLRRLPRLAEGYRGAARRGARLRGNRLLGIMMGGARWWAEESSTDVGFCS